MEIKASTPCGSDLAIHEFVFSFIADFPVRLEVNEVVLVVQLLKDGVIEMTYNSDGLKFKVPIHCRTLDLTGVAVFTAKFVEGRNRYGSQDNRNNQPNSSGNHLVVTEPRDISHFGTDSGSERMSVVLIFQ